MLVLGWHGGWIPRAMHDSRQILGRHEVTGHDAAAVLMRDGRVVAAIEDERLNRVKHSNFFPTQAIRFCLAEGGVSLEDVDTIAVDTSEEFLDHWVLTNTLTDPGLMPSSGRQWLASLFARELGAEIAPKIRFCKHHVAHLHAAWYASEFTAGLGVCLDAAGDGPSGLIALWKGDSAKILRHISVESSLGYFYLRSIAILGYRLFDEYKVMGLAPYGDPTVFAPLFERMYRLLPQGRFALATDSERLQMFQEADLAWRARRKGEEFNQTHKDFAAALQVALERIATHLLSHFQQSTAARSLCLSGGVAHNCAMVGQILRSGLFEQVYVVPVAHDAGNALGAALWATREADIPIPRDVLRHVYLGTDVGTNDAIGQRLADWSPHIAAAAVNDPSSTAAQLIADGAVIAWVQGRSEFGPRALGNRSILADPRPAENMRIINAMVKKRESYRPFAPSVLQERVRDFFEVPTATDAMPFMTIVLKVRAEMRGLLGAITHVDGTARVQTVSCSDNAAYHALIEAFGALTGVPIVLNTSFNNNAEPIVDTIDDAVTCFLTTGIEFLVIGNWVVRKTSRASDDAAWLDLVPSLPDGRRLVQRRRDGDEASYTTESIAHRFFATSVGVLSATMYELLLQDSDGATLRARCQRLGVESPQILRQLSAEAFDLWQRRLIALAPPPCLTPTQTAA